MKLHEIADEHKELMSLVDRNELTVDDIQDTADGIEGMFEDKAQSIMAIHTDMGQSIETLDAEIKRLQDRKKTIENKQKSWREYLRINMEKTGIKKIECPLFTITLASGRDTVVVDDADLVPDEYIDIQVVQKPDKRAIMSKIKAGEDVPGCRIEKTQNHVRIK